MSRSLPWKISDSEEIAFQNSLVCHLCERSFDQIEVPEGCYKKYRDHSHMEQRYLGAR